MLSLLIVLLILQQHFEFMAASRTLYSTAMPRYVSRKQKPLPIHAFVINRFKMIETDAYRPTSPGHSPGVGHLAPPSTPKEASFASHPDPDQLHDNTFH